MDDPGPALSIILKLLLLFVLIIVNAFFAMSEIAIISLNDAKMQKLAELMAFGDFDEMLKANQDNLIGAVMKKLRV